MVENNNISKQKEGIAYWKLVGMLKRRNALIEDLSDYVLMKFPPSTTEEMAKAKVILRRSLKAPEDTEEAF